ncbi:hypothetical protein ABG067_007182 [Albugo candida]
MTAYKGSASYTKRNRKYEREAFQLYQSLSKMTSDLDQQNSKFVYNYGHFYGNVGDQRKWKRLPRNNDTTLCPITKISTKADATCTKMFLRTVKQLGGICQRTRLKERQRSEVSGHTSDDTAEVFDGFFELMGFSRDIRWNRKKAVFHAFHVKSVAIAFFCELIVDVNLILFEETAGGI